jgi:hypothetical protein
MSSQAILERSPEQIEADIVARRASLDRKLHDLETRLSPKARFNELRARVHPQEYLGLAAVAAVATGTALAVRGFRRTRREEPASLDDLEFTGVVCECE